jgi:hypothetical protein
VSAAVPRAGGAAVLALAAGVALPGFVAAPAPVPCTTPGARAERAGRTIEVACHAGESAALRGPARLLFGLRLDANRASAEALEALPRVGPERARALVAARAERPFCAPEDLERVSGIGPRTRKLLEHWLEFAEDGACSRAHPGQNSES